MTEKISLTPGEKAEWDQLYAGALEAYASYIKVCAKAVATSEGEEFNAFHTIMEHLDELDPETVMSLAAIGGFMIGVRVLGDAMDIHLREAQQ